jgi:hypothetical protein
MRFFIPLRMTVQAHLREYVRALAVRVMLIASTHRGCYNREHSALER